MGVKQIVHVNNLSYNTSGFHSVLIEHIRNKCIELLIKVQFGRINSMLYDHFCDSGDLHAVTSLYQTR